MAESDVRLPHLLVIVGAGGPSPELLARSLAGIARISWLFDPRDLTRLERDVPIMAEAGRAVAVSSDEGLVAAAAALHVECPADGLLTFSENALRSGAAAAEKLGLPFNSVQAAERLTNKYLQRQALSAAGVPCPRFHPVRGADELTAAGETVGFPAVLKPVMGGGSARTSRVDSPAELRAAWNACAARLDDLDGLDRPHRPLSDTAGPHMMLEELLVGVERGDDPRYGDQVSVESITSGGAIRHLAVGDRLSPAPGFRENGQVHPSVLAAAEQARITGTASAALEALGVTEGITHIKLKLTADGPRVIEADGRPAHGLWLTLLHAAGYDLIAAAARVSLRLGTAALPEFTRYAALLTPSLDRSLADEHIEVRLDPSFRERDGVHSVHRPHSGASDLSPSGGHAVLACVSAAEPEGIHAHERALRAALRIER